jgi:Lrp/AsnC family leucine-responsive transcriptional regulator
MDAIDKKIVELIQENSRLSITELATLINLSRPSISERLTRLIENGVFQRFSADVSPQKLGLGIHFFIELSQLKIPSDKLVALLSSNPYIYEIHCVTGITNYIAKAAMPDIETMNAFLAELTTKCHVVTSVILHSPLPHGIIRPV